MRKYALILAAVCTIFAAGLASGQEMAASSEDVTKQVHIGVLAKRGNERCLEKWGPTAEYLTAEIRGHAFSIVPFGYGEILPAVERGEVDFVLANPACYVLFEHDYGVRSIATRINLQSGQGHTEYAGALFTRADRNDIEQIADLDGKTFMAVSEFSFGGWHMIWRKLKKSGFDPHSDFANLRFGGTHDAVVYAVRDGEVDAGSVRSDTLEHMAIEGKIRVEDFRVLNPHEIYDDIPCAHSTRHYAEWPLATLSSTSGELSEKVAIALFEMPRESRAAQAARCMGWTTPADYVTVRECLQDIRVRPYEDYGKVTLDQVLRQHWAFVLTVFGLLLVSMVFGFHAVRSKRQIAIWAQSLREEKEFENSLIETAQVIILVLDMEGRILRFNSYMEQLLGYRLEEVRGKDWFSTFLPKRDGNTLRELFEKAINDIQTRGKVNTIVAKNGRELDVEWYDKTLKDAEGNTIGLLAIGHNITERKRAEEEREQLFHTTSKRVKELRCMYGVAESIRKRETLEQIFEDVVAWIPLGWHCPEIARGRIRFDDQEYVSQPFEETEWRQGADIIVAEELRGTVEVFYVEAFSFQECLKLGEGQFLKEERDLVKGIAYALSEAIEHRKVKDAREEAEEQLRQAQKMEAIGTLAGGIAHDFNNILGAIIGYSELMLRDVSNGERVEPDNMKHVLEAGMRARELVGQILTFSRQIEHKKVPLRIGSVVKETLKLLTGALPTTIEIRENIVRDARLVFADPTQIHQVIMNLCTNASHAMREKGGVLDIMLTPVDFDAEGSMASGDLTPGPYLQLTVSDTGHGMDSAVLEQIFDPFFTTKEPGEGTGLGLAVVHGIVKDHGGTISVHSEVGKGTTFQVLFPITETAESEEVVESVQALLPRGTEKLLIVDDEEALLDIAREVLMPLGYEVATRRNGSEALEAIVRQQGEFDLVVTDLTMPEMTGIELAKALGKARVGIPMILCTGVSHRLTLKRARKLGFEDLLPKPVRQCELAESVRRVLDQNK